MTRFMAAIGAVSKITPACISSCAIIRRLTGPSRTGLSRVEAGAQGEHKLARGYLPMPVHSLHYIADPAFRDAVARYLVEERRAVDEEIEVLTAYGPFRRVASED